MRFVKNVYRSTMREEHLNALLLLFIHKDIALDYAAIVDDYAKRNQRRMTFVNPLQWLLVNPLTAEWALRSIIDFTLSNARRFYSSMGNPLDGKGLKSFRWHEWMQLHHNAKLSALVK